MKRLILTPLAAVFAFLALTIAPAAAQNITPFQPPRYGPGYQTPLSPYLNMLRGGDPAANYFLGVQPEFQRRQDRNIMYGSIQGITNLLPRRPGITEGEIDVPLASTGHATAFGYTGTYFGGGNQMGRMPGNPFGQRQAGGQWPSNQAQPAGKQPIKR